MESTINIIGRDGLDIRITEDELLLAYEVVKCMRLQQAVVDRLQYRLHDAEAGNAERVKQAADAAERIMRADPDLVEAYEKCLDAAITEVFGE